MDGASWSMMAGVVPCRGPLEQQLDALKERLLQPILKTVADSALARELRRAGTEAAALAWYTACPILILPTLLEEKVRAVWKQWEKQEAMRPPGRFSSGSSARGQVGAGHRVARHSPGMRAESVK